MIVKESDVLGCMYNDSSGSARSYKYYATVVYDGEVYDEEYKTWRYILEG